MNLSCIINASKMHFTLFLRPAGLKKINKRYINSTTMCYRKSLQEYKAQEAKKVRFYITRKYLNFLGKHSKLLDKVNKRFPVAMHMYRMFTAGVGDFISEAKQYFKIIRILSQNNNDFTRLNRKEIELYDQMPKDMRKLAPVLLISTLPFAYYVIFPAMYYFPRHLLTSHFWNIQQKSDYYIIYLRKRLKHNRPVLRCLQEQLDHLKGHSLYIKWSYILGMLGSGAHPSVEQILECNELFSSEPYNLNYLRPVHVKHLVRMHALHMGFFRRSRLADRALILVEMDKAILREGGVHNLLPDSLRKACYIRGLNPANMKNEDMVIWMQNWVKLSRHVNKDNLSLMLHAPILLAYNEPTNWLIIYS